MKTPKFTCDKNFKGNGQIGTGKGWNPKNMNSFHNSIEATGTELETFEAKTQTQEEKVLEFFKLHYGGMFTPPFIQKQVLPNAPITSVRRALTNLTNKGLLIKTSIQASGMYDKPNYCWRLAERAEQTKLF